MARVGEVRGSRHVVDTWSRRRIEWRRGSSVSSLQDKPHVPAPSLWPIGFAVGVVCLLVGFVVSWWGVAIGAALAVAFGFLWVYDLTRGMREPVHAPVPGTATVEVSDAAAPAHAAETPTYSRSVLLELGTLGLGGVIGGLVTLPALGFAVLPAFEHHKRADIDLGPITNFPQDEFVVVDLPRGSLAGRGDAADGVHPQQRPRLGRGQAGAELHDHLQPLCPPGLPRAAGRRARSREGPTIAARSR